MTPVPWVTTPPDQIEQIVAVLLGNKDERAFRIRPSRGDGGLDVLVPTERAGYFDDYQVKKFATNLDDSQKRQIVESLTRARHTHNDPESPFLIENWYLTLPLNPTREQITWLKEQAENLAVPFKVAWRGLDFLERLAADYPQVIDYYLHDGRDRLETTIVAVRDLAQLGVSATGAALEPSDVTERLGNLLQALNRDDPHYRYDFEVTTNEPFLFDRPQLVTSIMRGTSNGYVTYHVYARYPNATEDRPIPITFNVAQAELTPEALSAFNDMLQYGTPVDLPESAVTDINIDMPAGLGLENGSGRLYLGPARRPSDQPSRVVWAIVPEDSTEPLAQLTFEMEAPTWGMSGGMQVHGIDTTGVVDATIRIDPPENENRTVSISVSVIDPAGKPVAQVLPGLRFLRQYNASHRLAFGSEYGPLRVVEEIPLPGSPQSIPAMTLEYVESLEVISRRSGTGIQLPDLAEVSPDDFVNIVGLGRVLRGERVPLTWQAMGARLEPAAINLGNNIRPLMTAQDASIEISGVRHDLGRFYTYLLSPRIQGASSANRNAEGKIPVVIVPDENDSAIMTSQPLTIEEARGLLPESDADTA